MMGSVARNLDRLSLDEEHIRLNEEARRSLPPGLPEGLYRGLRGLARSIMGGATGLVSGPISGPTMLGRVLLAALTMPISATADLLAFTSQGLLGQVGWAPQPKVLYYHHHLFLLLCRIVNRVKLQRAVACD